MLTDTSMNVGTSIVRLPPTVQINPQHLSIALARLLPENDKLCRWPVIYYPMPDCAKQ